MSKKIDRCYCKKCEEIKEVKDTKIDCDDRLNVTLSCDHIRIFQLVTSKQDYREKIINKIIILSALIMITVGLAIIIY